MRWTRIPLILALLLLAGAAAATPPPVPFCQLNPRRCFPVPGATREHFFGIMQQVFRAIPKIPGYRCEVARRDVDRSGYGLTARRAAPERMVENILCFHRGADRHQEAPAVMINVEISVLPALIGEGGARKKEGARLVFAESKRVRYVFGKARKPDSISGTEWAVASSGPYLDSVQVVFDAESPAAVNAFSGGFDRAVVSELWPARINAGRTTTRRQRRGFPSLKDHRIRPCTRTRTFDMSAPPPAPARARRGG